MNSYERIIYELLGSFWTKVWRETELIDGLVSGFAAIHRDLDQFSKHLKDYLARLNVLDSRVYHFRNVVLSEVELVEVPVRLGDFNIGDNVRLGDKIRPFKWQASTVYTDVNFIVDKVADPAVIFVRNQDFVIDDGVIIFLRNPFDAGFKITAKVTVDGNVERAISLWLLSAELPLGVFNDLFGKPVKWFGQLDLYGKRLLNALWDLRVQGATNQNVLRLLTTIADADIAKVAGVISSVWTEAGRIFVAIGDELHSAPDRYNALKTVGMSVEVGEPLFDVVEVYSGNTTIPESAFLGLCIDSSFIDNGFKGGLIFVNSLVDLSYEFILVDPSVIILQETEFTFTLVKEGIEVTVDKTADLLEYGIVKTPIFNVGGSAETVSAYRRYLARRCWELKLDLWSKLTEEQEPPYRVNPMKFVQDSAFGHNMLFISYSQPIGVFNTLSNYCLRLLDELVPAGTSFLLFQGLINMLDGVDSTNVKDGEVTSFLFSDGSESVVAKVADFSKVSSKQY